MPERPKANGEEHAMEKKPRAAAAGGDGGGTRGEASGSSEGGGLVERLPEALLVEVLCRLEVDDACSASASCRALQGAAAAAISTITTIDLSVRLPSLPRPPRPPSRGTSQTVPPERWGLLARYRRRLLRRTRS